MAHEGSSEMVKKGSLTSPCSVIVNIFTRRLRNKFVLKKKKTSLNYFANFS